MIVLTGASEDFGTALLSELSQVDRVIAVCEGDKPSTLENGNIDCVMADLMRADDIERLVSSIEIHLVRTTVVHAAGVNMKALVPDDEGNTWEKYFLTNLKTNFMLTKALLPIMIGEKWGRIVHLMPLANTQVSGSAIEYSASRSGLEGMSRVLAKEYARFNVTSNILSLGYFKSEYTESLSEDEKKEVLKRIPSRRFGDISNIAQAIQFLMRSDYVNGTQIQIDGGL
jgi:NAD(P)-dependent dehydrogenase (short-subunit alcohol dehydrogenase family)